MQIFGVLLIVIVAVPGFAAGMLYASLAAGFIAGRKVIDDLGDALVKKHSEKKKKETSACGS